MLPCGRTGKDVEVDVVIRSRAPYPVTISVEAVGRSRKADRTWVNEMVGKHADLATNKLVLVSERGFTKNARELAVAHAALPLAPEDLEGTDPAFRIVNALPSLWPKLLSFTIEKARVFVHRPHEGLSWFWAPADLLVFLDSGEEAGDLLSVIRAVYGANFERTAEQIGLADIAETTESGMVWQVGPGWTVTLDDGEHRVCVRYDETEEPELHAVEKIEAHGKVVIKVGEVPLKHRRLGEVMYAYGEGHVGEQAALLVASENEEGGKLTLRFRTDAGTEADPRDPGQATPSE